MHCSRINRYLPLLPPSPQTNHPPTPAHPRASAVMPSLLRHFHHAAFIAQNLFCCAKYSHCTAALIPSATAPTINQLITQLRPGIDLPIQHDLVTARRPPDAVYATAAAPGSRDAPYIFDIVGPSSGDAIAVSLSSNVIRLYALQQPGSGGSPGGLQHMGDLGGHTGRITDIAFPFAAQPHALFSCSRDGTLKGWDARSGQAVEECALSSRHI